MKSIHWTLTLCFLLVLGASSQARPKGAELLRNPLRPTAVSHLATPPAPAYPVLWPAVQTAGAEAALAPGTPVRSTPLASYRVQFNGSVPVAILVETILRDGTDGVVGVRRVAGSAPHTFEVEGWFTSLSATRAAIESGFKRAVNGLPLRGVLFVAPKDIFGQASVTEHAGADPVLEIILPMRQAGKSQKSTAKTDAQSQQSKPTPGTSTSTAPTPADLPAAISTTNTTSASGSTNATAATNTPPGPVQSNAASPAAPTKSSAAMLFLAAMAGALVPGATCLVVRRLSVLQNLRPERRRLDPSSCEAARHRSTTVSAERMQKNRPASACRNRSHQRGVNSPLEISVTTE